MINRLENAKKVIKEYYSDAQFGIFNTRNIAGDEMTNIYRGDGVTIDICYGYSYFEVFGLTENEFEELSDYYDSLEVEMSNDSHNHETIIEKASKIVEMSKKEPDWITIKVDLNYISEDWLYLKMRLIRDLEDRTFGDDFDISKIDNEKDIKAYLLMKYIEHLLSGIRNVDYDGALFTMPENEEINNDLDNDSI